MKLLFSTTEPRARLQGAALPAMVMAVVMGTETAAVIAAGMAAETDALQRFFPRPGAPES